MNPEVCVVHALNKMKLHKNRLDTLLKIRYQINGFQHIYCNNNSQTCMLGNNYS